MERRSHLAFMPDVQQSGPAVSALGRGSSTSVRAPDAACLRVLQGRMWITRTATDRGIEDLVLGPGDRLVLAAGEHVVLESWEDARWRLDSAPGRAASFAQRLARLCRRLGLRPRATPVPPPCGA
ncbi:MAG TPA: DUF2917 domain-containing protein [Burkholderiaceae bacterium]|nr:DUF2917 domain-containing protein [Burkholderiaceae bacterium]